VSVAQLPEFLGQTAPQPGASPQVASRLGRHTSSNGSRASPRGTRRAGIDNALDNETDL
jgi:hypothetical protein